MPTPRTRESLLFFFQARLNNFLPCCSDSEANSYIFVVVVAVLELGILDETSIMRLTRLESSYWVILIRSVGAVFTCHFLPCTAFALVVYDLQLMSD